MCSWPGEEDLFDRRHRRASRSPRPSSSSPEPVSRDILFTAIQGPASVDAWPSFIYRELVPGDVVSLALKSNLEVDFLRHFLDGLVPLLILSNSHPVYHFNLIPELVEMVKHFAGCKDVMLACGASHMHLLTGNAKLHEAGIKYYSRAVSQINRALGEIDWSNDEFNDALLLGVIFLYIHEVGVASLLQPSNISSLRSLR